MPCLGHAPARSCAALQGPRGMGKGQSFNGRPCPYNLAGAGRASCRRHPRPGRRAGSSRPRSRHCPAGAARAQCARVRQGGGHARRGLTRAPRPRRESHRANSKPKDCRGIALATSSGFFNLHQAPPPDARRAPRRAGRAVRRQPGDLPPARRRPGALGRPQRVRPRGGRDGVWPRLGLRPRRLVRVAVRHGRVVVEPPARPARAAAGPDDAHGRCSRSRSARCSGSATWTAGNGRGRGASRARCRCARRSATWARGWWRARCCS